VKAVKKEVTVRRNYVRHIEVELSILEQLRGHPFIVSLFSCFQTDANLLFVLEYAQGADLRKLLEANTIIRDPSASFYAAEIAIAIQFLHSKGVVHRDLKLDNVLMDKEGHVKVTDFGLSAVGVTETDRITGFCGTPNYIAPEVILRPGAWGSVVVKALRL
jgi:serine/threonine protein kinase